MDLLLWAYISIVLISYIGDQYQLFPLQTNITSIDAILIMQILRMIELVM